MQYIEFGKITSTHGIKGEMKIYPYTDNIDNILKLKKVYISSKEYIVSSIKFHKNMFISWPLCGNLCERQLYASIYMKLKMWL